MASGGLPLCLTSIVVSFPPDIIKPSEYSAVGWRYVTALINEEPCEDNEQSYFRGFRDISLHWRTVESLEAERTRSGRGKATART